MADIDLQVVVPVRNGEKFIVESLASLSACPEVTRIVVVDGQSEDSTRKLVQDYRDSKDAAPILIADVPHHNQYFSKNQGLRIALGGMLRADYVGFQDADDVCVPDRFTKQLACMKSDTKIWAVGSAFRNMNEEGKLSEDEIAQPLDENPMLRGIRSVGIGLWNATALYDSRIFKYLGGFDYTPTMGDTEFYVRLSFLSSILNMKMRNVREPLLHRRVHPNQVSSNQGSASSKLRVAYTARVKAEHLYYRTLMNQGLLRAEHLYRNTALPGETPVVVS